MLTGVFILVAAVGLFWLAWRRPRARGWRLPRRVLARAAVAAIDSQHRHLQSGGMLGEETCEKTRNHFRELLDAGRSDLIERELRAGLDFAVQVRALADLASPDAARVLEVLLVRPLAGDAVEQAWYWVDVAAGLRRLNRLEALPAVLRCADAAAELPPGAVLAAEAVAFPNFPATLKQPATVLGRMALRALVVTARAVRAGHLELATALRGGLGDILADVAARAEPVPDPWLTAAVIEAERVFRRLGHWVRVLPADARIAAERQAMRLWATSEERLEWLVGAPGRLVARFITAGAEEQGAALRCLAELRADPISIFPHLPDHHAPWWVAAVQALRWSKSPIVGPVLANEANRFTRKSRNHARAAAVLTTLRGHACFESESALLRAARATNLVIRTAALSSLGWWPPFDPDAVVRTLRSARTDADPEVRRTAVSALARLGERAALDELTAGLHGEEPAIRVDAAARIGAEELTWLWPDLETAATASDVDTALAAGEALERLREQLFGFAP
jgi:hypothetical protein